MLPSSMGGRDASRRERTSSTVTIAPRTLIRPRTDDGAPGRRVAGLSGRISCASPMSQPYTTVPTRNSSVGVAFGSRTGVVESKEVQRVGVDQRNVRAGGDHERAMQIVRQR